MKPLEPLTAWPQQEGVGASVVWLPPGPWVTVLEFLCHRFPRVGLEPWRRRLNGGLVLDEQGQAYAVDTAYRPQSKLYYFRHVETEPRIPFDEVVLYQDEHLVVADKPHFLPVTPGGRFVQETLLVRLKRKLGLPHLSPVHRIDLETAGLVIFSIHPHERGAYHALFRARVVHKTYEALAPWRPDLPPRIERHSRIIPGLHFMQMTEAPGEPNAHTCLELIEEPSHHIWTRWQLHPTTGCKHQLRVHMAALRMPILGDRIYPTLQPSLEGCVPDYREPLRLLAKALSFRCPVTGVDRQFESRFSLAV